MAKLLLILAGLNGLIAVAASAAGAHALTARLDDQMMAWFTQAAQFHLWHALALLGVGALAAAGHGSTWLNASAAAFQLGILLFCGTLYWLGLNGSGSLGPLHWLTPLGGLALMAGWALLAAAGWRVTS